MSTDEMSPMTGRFLREDGTPINIADLLARNIKAVRITESGQVVEGPCWVMGYSLVTVNPSSLTIYDEVVDGSPTDSKKVYPTVSWDSAALVDEFYKRLIYCDEGLYAALTGSVTEVFIYVIEE